MPPQEAYDRINVLLTERYREWYVAQANLPQWGEVIDRQVQKYIRGMQDVITANVYWRYVPEYVSIGEKSDDCISFHTTRYFGKDTDEVRETRVITIPPDQLIKNGLTLPHRRSSREPSCETASRIPRKVWIGALLYKTCSVVRKRTKSVATWVAEVL